MADVFTILTLPKPSDAFSALPSYPQLTSGTRDSSRSDSPPRKIARLNAPADATSAWSSSRLPSADSADKSGPTILRVTGHPIKPSSESVHDADYALVRRTIKILLTPGETSALPATYDRVSRACRAVVDEAGKGEGLYDVAKLDLERCVGSLERILITEERQSVEWLVPFTEACAWFEKQVGLLQSLLAYLDTRYAADRTHHPGIRRLAYTLFSKTVIGSARVTQAIVTGLADWLEWERNHKTRHPLRRYLPQFVQHIRAHGLYADIIESTYLMLTHTFYTKESNELVEGNKTPAKEFLHHAQQRSKEERERAEEVLPESSVAAVQDTTDSALLAGRLQWLAKDALESLMGERNCGQLKKMYKLFAKVGGLKVLSTAFRLYVQNAVTGIVRDQKRDEDMIPNLLELKAFARELVSRYLVDEVDGPAPSQSLASSSKSSATATEPIIKVNPDFSYGVTDAFRMGFKSRRNKPAELIAKHMDKAMRRGQKGKRDEDFQAELEQVLSLYRFTEDMDVFRTFYQRALAKRLLLARSASDDIEKAMLKKLQDEYDPEFSMGDSMFKDLMLSRDLTTEFLRRKEPDDTAQKMSVMVLQRSAWPFAARKTDIDLPTWMQDDMMAYTDFYNKKHKGHKLDWDHALGTATLKSRFKAGEKELSVSLYQAVILLLFNEDNGISYADIKERTRLAHDELKRTLQSLACGKKRVLKKVPSGKDVNETDVFYVNADFTDERYQVHINSIQVKETVEETRRTQNSIETDRKHALDAAIVRVMKAKKELMYEQLKTATIEAVKSHFVPEVSMIKQRIESLVEAEYLRRDADEMNKYFYVA